VVADSREEADTLAIARSLVEQILNRFPPNASAAALPRFRPPVLSVNSF
jgi:hypothetical protein